MTDGTWITFISIGVAVFFMLGVPVFLMIGFWVIGCSFVLQLPLDNIGAALADAFTDGFALLAMPLFILTGDLVNRSGIARRLSDFAYACLGWLRDGLAMVSLGACGLFAAISGSNSATTATIGSMLHPEMVKGGYDERFAAATAVAGGTVGIIIPPSIIFIVYGFLMNLPISDLFVAGIIPGTLMVCGMQLACWILCRLNGWGHLIPLQFERVLKTTFGARLGFFAIGLVLWGIYTGKFSPTEAAGYDRGLLCHCRACLPAALQVDGLEKRGSTAHGKELCRHAGGSRLPVDRDPFDHRPFGPDHRDPGAARSHIGRHAANPVDPWRTAGHRRLRNRDGGYYAVLFTAMIIVFISGTVLESLPVTIILAPIAHSIGVEPIQFAVIFLVGASIGSSRRPTA